MHPYPPLPKLTDHLGYWMRLVSNHVSFAFARKLENKGVTVAEWVMMRELHEVASLAPSRLAERMGMTRGAISKLADRLVAKGLVSRTDNLGDGRAHTLSLSVTGTHLVPELAALADENDMDFFACLTPDERRQIEQVLRKIVTERDIKGVPIS